jgi:peptidoglycan/LPS O-acetylase OafA/YrhL
MAVGALLAYLTVSPGRFRNMVTGLPKGGILTLYAITLAVYLFRDNLFSLEWGRVLERLIFAVLFGMIIVEQNFSDNSWFKFSDSKKISSWGIISYGLYCFHFFVISITIAIFGKLHLPIQHFPIALACALTALVITILTASLSYRFIEKPFLRRKEKFALLSRESQN